MVYAAAIRHRASLNWFSFPCSETFLFDLTKSFSFSPCSATLNWIKIDIAISVFSKTKFVEILMKWNQDLCVVDERQESVNGVTRCDIYVQQDHAKSSYIRLLPIGDILKFKLLDGMTFDDGNRFRNWKCCIFFFLEKLNLVESPV